MNFVDLVFTDSRARVGLQRLLNVEFSTASEHSLRRENKADAIFVTHEGRSGGPKCEGSVRSLIKTSPRRQSARANKSSIERATRKDVCDERVVAFANG